MLINNRILADKGGVGQVVIETPNQFEEQARLRPAVDRDAELVLAVDHAHQRDRQAYGLIYEHYCEPIYNYVLFKVGQIEAAEDICAQVFVRMIENVARFRWPAATGSDAARVATFSGWLYRIAHNLIADHHRRRVRRPTVPLDDLTLSLPDSDPAINAEYAVYRDQLAAALHHLSDLQSQVIALKFGAGYNNAEVAALLGRSEGAIKNVQYTALQKLQKLLDPSRPQR